ncbi:hypothetical protein ACJX0J_042342, partial [Zea mays]
PVRGAFFSFRLKTFRLTDQNGYKGTYCIYKYI